MANANSKVRSTVVGAVLIVIVGVGVGGLITVFTSAHKKAEKAEDQTEEVSKEIVSHDGSAAAHPLFQDRMASNYEKIQIQLGHMDEKIDRVLDAVEK